MSEGHQMHHSLQWEYYTVPWRPRGLNNLECLRPRWVSRQASEGPWSPKVLDICNISTSRARVPPCLKTSTVIPVPEVISHLNDYCPCALNICLYQPYQRSWWNTGIRIQAVQNWRHLYHNPPGSHLHREQRHLFEVVAPGLLFDISYHYRTETGIQAEWIGNPLNVLSSGLPRTPTTQWWMD